MPTDTSRYGSIHLPANPTRPRMGVLLSRTEPRTYRAGDVPDVRRVSSSGGRFQERGRVTTMRPIREITAAEENFRVEPMLGFNVIRRDPVEPEPVGTLILVPMRVMGYDRDCDGGLLARLEQVGVDEDLDDEPDPELLACRTAGEFSSYANCTSHHGLYPRTGIVASPKEIRALWNGVAK